MNHKGKSLSAPVLQCLDLNEGGDEECGADVGGI